MVLVVVVAATVSGKPKTYLIDTVDSQNDLVRPETNKMICFWVRQILLILVKFLQNLITINIFTNLQ